MLLQVKSWCWSLISLSQSVSQSLLPLARTGRREGESKENGIGKRKCISHWHLHEVASTRFDSKVQCQCGSRVERMEERIEGATTVSQVHPVWHVNQGKSQWWPRREEKREKRTTEQRAQMFSMHGSEEMRWGRENLIASHPLFFSLTITRVTNLPYGKEKDWRNEFSSSLARSLLIHSPCFSSGRVNWEKLRSKKRHTTAKFDLALQQGYCFLLLIINIFYIHAKEKMDVAPFCQSKNGKNLLKSRWQWMNWCKCVQRIRLELSEWVIESSKDRTHKRRVRVHHGGSLLLFLPLQGRHQLSIIRKVAWSVHHLSSNFYCISNLAASSLLLFPWLCSNSSPHSCHQLNCYCWLIHALCGRFVWMCALDTVDAM